MNKISFLIGYKSKRVDIDEDSKHKQTNKHTYSLTKRRKYNMGLCKNSKEEVGRHVPGTTGRRLTKA